MDTAVSVLQSIYDVYKTIKDGQEQFAETYDRMKALLGQLQSMEDADTLVQTEFLDKYLVLARDFLAYLKKYSQRKFLSKVFHQSEMLAEVEGFNQQLEALFQHFHLAMGSHIVEHNRNQEASMDELVRGMRVLLQGANAGHLMKTMQSSDDLLGGGNVVQSSGPVAQALAQGDVMRLVGYLCDSQDDRQVEDAAMALCELAEQDASRDAIVQAGAIPSLVAKLSANRPSPHSLLRVHAARTLRRLAVRDIYETAIVEAGAVPRLAALVLDSPTAMELETNAAMAALSNLTFQPQHKIVLLETPHLLARVIELVRIGSASQKKHAVNILRELANNDDCATAIREAGGITALVDLLHIGSDEQCASALTALWNMASREKNRTEIAAVGGVNAIVAQIRRGTTEEQRQLAASALAVLAQDDANDALIGAAGGVELLVTLLRTGTDGQKNSAAWALAELANDTKNAKTMLRSGVAPALMAAFRSGTDIQRAKAGLALVWIAQLAEDKETLVSEIGLSSIVSMLRGSLDQRQNAAGIIVGIVGEEDFQSELGQLGAVELLFDLVEKHSPKCTAARALGLLVREHEDNRQKLVDAGGVDVFIRMLPKLKAQPQGEGDDTYDNVFNVLLTLSGHSAEQQAHIVAAGALPFILDDLKNGSDALNSLAAELVVQISMEIPADDEANSLKMVVGVLLTALETETGEELNDGLIDAALRGLTWVATRPEGMEILGDEALGGIQSMLKLLVSETTNENKDLAGQVLGNMAAEEKYARLLIEAGALKTYVPLLSAKEEEIQCAGLYGIGLIAGHEELRKPIAQTTNLIKRVVKLLQAGGNEEVRQRSADTLSLLASDETIAAEIGLVSGVEELVTLVQNGGEDEAYSAGLALRSLANASENVDVLLVEIGAIDAAVVMITDGQEEAQTAGLELLEIMSANADAAAAMLSTDAVAQCVTALQSESSEWKELGLKTLINLNEVDSDAGGDEEEDSEEEEEDASAGSEEGEEGEEEEEDEEEGEEEEGEEEELTLYQQIIEAGGLEPLMEMLEEREAGERAGLIKLLDGLAVNDSMAKLKVGGCVSLLVEIVRDGSEAEQAAAAAAIVTVIDGSKRNAAAAIRAKVGDAFIQMLKTNSEFVDVVKTSTEELVAALKALKTVDATAAVKKLAKALTTEALVDEVESPKAVFETLVKLLSASTFVKTFVDAGAATICLDVVGETSASKTPERVARAVTLLSKVSRTKSRTKLVDGGAVDALTTLLKATPPESPLATTITETLTSLGASAY